MALSMAATMACWPGRGAPPGTAPTAAARSSAAVGGVFRRGPGVVGGAVAAAVTTTTVPGWCDGAEDRALAGVSAGSVRVRDMPGDVVGSDMVRVVFRKYNGAAHRDYPA